MQWPGDASVTISILWFQKSLTLVTTPQPMGKSTFYALKMNDAKCFVGCAVQGMGFVLEAEDYNRLLPAERQSVVRPFLVAQDLNTTPECFSKRQIIFFAGMELDEVEKFPNALSIVRERVKPYRSSVNRKAHRDRWWRYGDWRPGLYSKADKLESVFVVGLTSKHLSFAKVSSQIVFDQTTAVVTTDDMSMFAVLSSTIHQAWALEYGANLGGTPRYNPSRCFEPFPFTTSICLRDIGFEFDSARKDLMANRREGLTKTYNRFHDPDETSADVQKLRELHVEMDQAVAAAYGWTDLSLNHGFHETKQGIRFTISETARREVLQRLLKLNHERYAEELSAGLHDKKKSAKASAVNPKKATKKPIVAPVSLFDMEEDVAFPVLEQDKFLCGLLCNLVAAEPGLPALAYLDTLVIALGHERHKRLLTGKDRVNFAKQCKATPLSSEGKAPLIPWNDLKSILELRKAMTVNANVIHQGAELEAVQKSYPAVTPELVTLLRKASAELRDLFTQANPSTSQGAEILRDFEADRRKMCGAAV
jgi:hypothetical protein